MKKKLYRWNDEYSFQAKFYEEEGTKIWNELSVDSYMKKVRDTLNNSKYVYEA